MRIIASDLEQVLQDNLDDELREQCTKASLTYDNITEEERDAYVLQVVNTLVGDVVSAGEHRLAQWESGWSQNLADFRSTRDIAKLIPRYHGKHTLLHWRQQIIRPITSMFDYKIHCLIVDYAIKKYLSTVEQFFEFGCGPAYHLLRARRLNKDAHLVGLDWAGASQKIINEIKRVGIDMNISASKFDFYNPDASLQFAANSGILTVAALEQVGDRFEAFLQFLLKKRPRICVHIEPITELLDQNNLIDKLSILYFKKRNYLNGYLTRLRQLQSEGTIKIIREQRTYTGSFFIEGHSLVVWSPI